MFRIRKTAAVAVLAGLVGVGGTLTAQATVFANTSTTTNTLISAKCYHHHSSRTTTFRWVKAHDRYEAYSSPHHGTSDYNTCHS